MEIQEKIQKVAQADSQGRVIVKNVPEQFLGELAKEIGNFSETTKGNHDWSLIYNVRTDKLELAAACYDIYGKPINTLQREIEDTEAHKESIKNFILHASEKNFMETAPKRILEILAAQELQKLYTEKEEESPKEPAKKTAPKKRAPKKRAPRKKATKKVDK